MNIRDLDGDYQVSYTSNASGVYAQENVLIKHHIKNGVVSGEDSLGAVHSGTLTAIDNDHVAFEVTIDPAGNKNVITMMENGLLTNETQSLKGVYKISRKGEGILLTTIKSYGDTEIAITCKRV